MKGDMLLIEHSSVIFVRHKSGKLLLLIIYVYIFPVSFLGTLHRQSKILLINNKLFSNF